MAQANSGADVCLVSPQPAGKADNGGLVDVSDWLKAADTKALGNAEIKTSQTTINMAFEGTAIVTGRPVAMPGSHVNPLEVDLGGKNWVGLLLEYRQAHPSREGISFKESSPSLNRFTCTVTISECPRPLGGGSILFSRKKDAKQYAAKLAIEWLVENMHMPSDGGVSFPKSRAAALPPAFTRPNGACSPNGAQGPGPGPATKENDSDGPSYGQQLVQMCLRLGFSPPTYVIEQHEEFPAIYSGHALFRDDPRVLGPVGQFSNVYGKKKARETCARETLKFLEGIQAQRMRAVEGSSS